MRVESLGGEECDDLVCCQLGLWVGGGGDGGDLGIKLSEFGGNVWASWWFCSIEFSNVRLLKVAVAFRVVPISFEVAKAVSAVVGATGYLLSFDWFG